MMNQDLWKFILAGMVSGALFGFVLSPAGLGVIDDPLLAQGVASWVVLPGSLFMAVITMVIVPLVVSSIILGVSGSGNVAFVRRMGLRIVPYFLITSVLAMLMGIAFVLTIKPGVMAGGELLLSEAVDPTGGRSFDELTVPQRFVNLIPQNPVRAIYHLDLLQIVIGAIFMGVTALVLAPAVVKPVLDLCEAVQAMTMKIIEWAMMCAPVAVFALVADIMIRVGPGVFAGLASYMATVLLGLFSIIVMYGVILFVVARRSPFAVIAQSKEALLLAFSTSSSSATMPVTLRVVEENLGVEPDVTRFVVPLGTVINMDGTGMYQAVAAIFLCQLTGIDLSFGETVLLVVTMVGASIGTPSTPGVGIVVLATIVTGLGVPAAGIALILGVDRILDMCRTVINVAGDIVAANVMQRWMRGASAAAAA